MNPYAPPDVVSDAHTSGGRIPRGVRGVAVFLIVQGILETLLGVVCGVVGPFVATSIASEVRTGRAFKEDSMRALLIAVYVLLGVVGTLGGGLKIVAGVKTLNLRGGSLRFVALASCIVTSILCYCAPSAIALGIWGLVVHLRPDVQAAFRRIPFSADPPRA